MTYKKQEYTLNGHGIILQQVRGPDSSMGASEPKSWIDRKAGYASDAIEAWFESFDNDVSDFEKVKAVTEWMAENSVLFCNKCNTFYDADKSVGTGFAGHKCDECAKADATCQDGNKHDYKCINPGQKHNARVATKYKCKKCGKKKQTTPTG